MSVDIDLDAVVLLFGANGFIGRHVTDALVSRGVARVVGVSRHRPDLTEAHAWHEIDLVATDEAVIADLIAETAPTAIVNCVGAAAGPPSHLATVNTVLPTQLVQAIQKAAPSATFVHIGSAAEYGITPGHRNVAEDHPCFPVSPYGITKLAGTQLVVRASGDGLIHGVVLRAFNPVGPGMSDHTLPGRAVRLLFDAVQHDADSIQMGSLDTTRDFIDVRDIGDAVARAAQRRLAPGSVLNVARGRAVPVRRLVEVLANIAGFEGHVLEEGRGSPRSPGVSWQRADIRRVEAALGWQPQHSLQSSLETLWEDACDTQRRMIDA